MVEFLCGLVGISVLIAMLVQINRVSYWHTQMVIETRNDMAEQMSGGSLPTYKGDYLSGWEAGADNKDYTQDDVSKNGNASGFMDGMSTAMDISGLRDRVESHFPEDQYLKLSDSSSGNVAEAFGLHRVKGETDVEVLPVIRKLVADIESLKLQHEIYMPWPRNLMEEDL